MIRSVAATVALLALLVGATACGDDGGGTTTLPTGPSTTTVPTEPDTTTVPTGAGSVIFGEGELPDEFPDKFPMPDGSVVGSTLVTPTRTEVALVVRQPIEELTRFYETELVAAGYELVESAQQQFNWTISFTEPGTEGLIVLNANGDVTQLVIQLDAA